MLQKLLSVKSYAFENEGQIVEGGKIVFHADVFDKTKPINVTTVNVSKNLADKLLSTIKEYPAKCEFDLEFSDKGKMIVIDVNPL